MVYFIIFNAIFWLVTVLVFVMDPSPVSLTKAILYTAYLLIYTTVWKLRNRFKKKLVYMVLFLYIYMIILLYTLSTSALIEATPEEDQGKRD